MKGRKKIWNFHEQATYTILSKVAIQNGVKVFTKIRVADVLEINNSGLSNTQYSYALKSHFDFVITDSATEPLFAVEFDGPHHQEDAKSIVNDELKDSICQHFYFPILHANASFITKKIRKLTILRWLVQLWFMERDFERMQESSQIPFDEPFLYNFILHNVGENEITMPYDLSLPFRLLIKETHQKQIIKDSCPSIYIAEDTSKFVTAIALLRINDTKVIIGKARCRSYQFSPVSPWELCQELATIDVGEKLKAYLKKQTLPCSMDQARQEIKRLEYTAEQSNSVIRHTGILW